MNIVVLDGFTLNPGDLSWDGLKALGPCTIYDRTPTEKVVARAADAAILLTNKTLITRAHLQHLSGLRYIGVLATGYNVVDVQAARERSVAVTNVPAYGTRSVAQMTFALLLELALHVGHHAQSVRQGRWTQSQDFCFWDYPLIELEQRTMGIVGYGRIGRAVAELARAFGMEVLVHTRTASTPPPARVEFVELETLLRQSDVVSLHCPLTPQTERLVNAERISWMRSSALLLNTSRGALVDEAALALALNEERIAGAGLDVLVTEPPASDNPLLTAKNCLVTPHIAWATQAGRSRLMNAAVANLKAFLEGKPQNVVSG
jgi:glycerate dehydrogenase